MNGVFFLAILKSLTRENETKLETDVQLLEIEISAVRSPEKFLNGHKIFGRTFRSPMHRRCVSLFALDLF